MGRPPLIDRELVLATALELADEHGLEALTMGAVARQLGVTPMALYRHVGNKADLVDGVVELLLTQMPEPSPALPWSERLTDLASGILRTARRHPNVFPVLLQHPVTTSGARRARRAVYAALADAGVPADRVAQVERLVSTAVLGFAVSDVAGRFRGHSRRQVDEDFDVLLALLGRFVASEVDGSSEGPARSDPARQR